MVEEIKTRRVTITNRYPSDRVVYDANMRPVTIPRRGGSKTLVLREGDALRMMRESRAPGNLLTTMDVGETAKTTKVEQQTDDDKGSEQDRKEAMKALADSGEGGMNYTQLLSEAKKLLPDGTLPTDRAPKKADIIDALRRVAE